MPALRRLATTLLILCLPTAVWAAPRRAYIPIAPPAPKTLGPRATAAAGPPALIYLNRCASRCTVTPGNDDSRSNTSSIITHTISVSPFDKGETAWQDVVRCVRRIYAPFNIQIVDQDPGSVPHHEAIVAGDPTESGFPEEYGGVAPYACGEIPNSITYSFANIWWTAEEICETVAQETAHAFGLDHALLCSDPMTYLAPCGQKSFQNTDADCGEDKPRACYCGGTKQNSFRSILDMFGPGQVAIADIVRPTAGEQVRAGFVIEADPGSAPVVRVEVSINGEKIATGTSQPYIFNAPVDLPPGPLDISVVAYDRYDVPGEARVQVQLASCASDAACGKGYECIAGRCVAGPGQVGGLGESCQSNDECSGDLCGESGGEKICSASCDPGHDDCPSGFSCTDSPSGPVCWPGSGGCSSTGRGGAMPWLPLLAAMFALRFVRRRGICLTVRPRPR